LANELMLLGKKYAIGVIVTQVAMTSGRCAAVSATRGTACCYTELADGLERPRDCNMQRLCANIRFPLA
jgi:hypothetical protein